MAPSLADLVHAPNSDHESLQASNINYTDFHGKWRVVASTLPLWRKKKNVCITYSLVEGQPESTLDDLVEFNREADAPGAQPWKVHGVDTLEQGAGARWKWRGKGLLKISSSNWQLLGYHVIPASASNDSFIASTPTDEPEWALTYFSSTMFTPAGLDVYTRANELSTEFIDALVVEITKLGGELEKLVENGGLFRIPHETV